LNKICEKLLCCLFIAQADCDPQHQARFVVHFDLHPELAESLLATSQVWSPEPREAVAEGRAVSVVLKIIYGVTNAKKQSILYD
jgi:hypothetical protein